LQLSLSLPSLAPVNDAQHGAPCEDVRIKQLASTPDINDRLREMGFCEEREIRLISQSANLLCQVCNARLGLNPKIAQAIWVEPLRSAPASKFA
jgi:Fe2+ transport system protein FeoA